MGASSTAGRRPLLTLGWEFTSVTNATGSGHPEQIPLNISVSEYEWQLPKKQK
jgi:hypothetical protein